MRNINLFVADEAHEIFLTAQRRFKTWQQTED